MKIVIACFSWISRTILFLFGILNLIFGIMQAADPTWRLANDPAPSLYIDPPYVRMLYLAACPVPLVVVIFWKRIGRLISRLVMVLIVGLKKSSTGSKLDER